MPHTEWPSGGSSECAVWPSCYQSLLAKIPRTQCYYVQSHNILKSLQDRDILEMHKQRALHDRLKLPKSQATGDLESLIRGIIWFPTLHREAATFLMQVIGSNGRRRSLAVLKGAEHRKSDRPWIRLSWHFLHRRPAAVELAQSLWHRLWSIRSLVQLSNCCHHPHVTPSQ